jgi:hypothetical protein
MKDKDIGNVDALLIETLDGVFLITSWCVWKMLITQWN